MEKDKLNIPYYSNLIFSNIRENAQAQIAKIQKGLC